MPPILVWAAYLEQTGTNTRTNIGEDMANYHIGAKSADGRHADVYVHLPVPATENVAGVALGGGVDITYQDAQAAKLLKDNPGGFVSDAPGIVGAEQTLLTNGELVEKFVRFRFDSLELTNVERRDQIEGGNENVIGVAQMLVDIADSGSDLYKELIEPLAWWGYYRDIS